MECIYLMPTNTWTILSGILQVLYEIFSFFK